MGYCRWLCDSFDGDVPNALFLLMARHFCLFVSEVRGVQVRKGAEKVMMPTRGETFDTVMAAIGSHPGHETVVLEFLRPDPVPDVEADVEFGWGVGAAASGGESAP